MSPRHCRNPVAAVILYYRNNIVCRTTDARVCVCVCAALAYLLYLYIISLFNPPTREQ